jgi:undecaprenyl phosphate N,N'-diacetylbacillosamine 1-phosphate transferase
MYRTFIKRLIDVAMALIILLFASPIFLLTWFLLVIQNRGKAFFYQQRPGLNEKPFTIIKFKTMNDMRDKSGALLPDVQRLTRLGKIVRKLSIDELPQLINVLLGDMSLIGPRPLLFKYIPLYSEEQKRRHSIRPGITGWAQVNGRNAISWTKKFELDLFYVDHLSFQLDCEIFFKTILKVFKREGINQSEARPMEPFTGNN